MRDRFERPEDIAFVINPSVWYKSMYPTGISVSFQLSGIKRFPECYP